MGRARFLRMCLGLWTLWAVSCGDATAPGEGAADRGTGLDAGGSGGDSGRDPLDPFDFGPSVDARGLGAAFGEPCADNLDCASGWCVPFEDRLVCTRTCLQDGCPGEWGCHAVANTRPDVVFICFPPGNRLCGACVADGDCPNGACHTVDGQRVCGLSCETDEACPPGYACGDDALCAPVNGSCTCSDRNAGAERLCEVSNAAGTCLGRETCAPAQGWIGCDAQTPAPEICNALDDDCNGFADDIVGLGEACSREAEVEGATLTCTGRRVCSAEAGPEPICTAPVPAAETCNFLDDDCDGETDEGFDERGRVCRVGVGACERVGVFACTEDERSVACNVTAGAPAEERCDGLDNDCDGTIDEDFPALNGPCEVGFGACRGGGAVRCAPDGLGTVCDAVAGAPAAETCDGRDNDCDGEIDEGYAALGRVCQVGLGACQRNGVNVCTEDGAGVACDARPGLPAEELCDARDNDCDGLTDEGFEGINTPCTRGVGACLRPGVNLCSADGVGLVCSASPGQPGAELCNAIDDDCDGRVDEAFAALNRPCEAGVGACRQVGVQVCAPGGAGTLCDAVAGAPAAETCNGLDDDCDGQVDETFAEVGRACDAGVGECRRGGVQVCTADGAGTRCDAAAGAPAAEVCNYRDDDCDGRVDEQFTDAQGRYLGVSHCGACGADCNGLWAGGPAAAGVVPGCAVSGGVAQCNYTCLPGYRDADGLAQNGCELLVDVAAIYVSTSENGGVFANDCGTLQRPCAGIALGLERARVLGRARVRVSDGVYDETVDLLNGIELLGGHHRSTWQRDPNLNVTVIDGRTEDDPVHRYGVRAVGLALPTVLDGFVIRSESPLVGGNSYGVYVRDTGAALTVRNNRIFPGDGGRGLSGASGASGVPGVGGGAGRNSFGVLQVAACPSAGGAGGARACGVTGVNGGAGAGHASCPVFRTNAGPGQTGFTPRGGVGGASGWNGGAVDPNECIVAPDGPFDARAGNPGTSGTDGAGGPGAAAGLGSAGSHWLGGAGQPGVSGAPGGGGGGGGAAAGVQVAWAGNTTYDVGATGGGGGSGGCQGNAGAAGQFGGGSFGVFVTFTGAGPQGAGDLPRIEGNRILRGLGGAGGDGGVGGGGGEGGGGGPGGVRGPEAALWMGFCSLVAGNGGTGGRGGHGGGGGGGQGGASFDVFVSNSNGVALPYAAQNVFELPAGELTGGRGGTGGAASNTAIGLGGAGAAGSSGHVAALP